jgi:hypothetical protein
LKNQQSEEHYSDEETARRRDKALLRALNTPPQPHSQMKLGKRKAKAGTKGNADDPSMKP